jgi:hypothetical protein
MCAECGTQIRLTPTYKIQYQKNGSTSEHTICGIYKMIKITEADLRGSQVPSKLRVQVVLKPQEYFLAFWNPVWFSRETGATMQPLFEGTIILTTDRVVFLGNEKSVALALKGINSVTIEGDCHLQIFNQSNDSLYEAVFKKGSALLWQDYLIGAIGYYHAKNINRS